MAVCAPDTVETMQSLAVVFWAACALILYTYIGFPVLLALLARRHGAPPPPDVDVAPEELPRVAMVVAAYNEAGNIPQKLANTWEIDYPADRFQLVMGSDGSSDATAELLRSCHDPRLRAFPFPERRG